MKPFHTLFIILASFLILYSCSSNKSEEVFHKILGSWEIIDVNISSWDKFNGLDWKNYEKPNYPKAVMSFYNDTTYMMTCKGDSTFGKFQIRYGNLLLNGTSTRYNVFTNKDRLKITEITNSNPTKIMGRKLDSLVQKTKSTASKKRDFLKIPIKKSFTIDYNDINFGPLTKGKNWSYDRTGNGFYHYSAAERGEKYIKADLTISSSSKKPLLPSIALYEFKNGFLHLVDVFQYKFYKWESSSSYNGLEKDLMNDFSYTEKIKFSVGLKVQDEVLENTLFVVAKNNNCLYRKESTISEPPVSYKDNDCFIRKVIDLETLNKEYKVVQIFQ